MWSTHLSTIRSRRSERSVEPTPPSPPPSRRRSSSRHSVRCAPGGTLVLVALPPDNSVTLPIFQTVLNGLTVVGSIVGTRQDLAEVYALHALGRTKVIRPATRPSAPRRSMIESSSLRVSDHLGPAQCVQGVHLGEILPGADDRAHHGQPVQHGLEDRQGDRIVRRQRNEDQRATAAQRTECLLEDRRRDGGG